MGYLHINNLYKNTEIMLFRRCFALEKIHGTSAHVSWKDGQLNFFSGGAKHETFVSIFDKEALTEYAKETGIENFTIFGEAYGGRMQGQSRRYGKDLKFVCFDVKIDDCWIAVPSAERFCLGLGLEFVDYVEISTDIEEIDAQRDRPSVQAVRNGCGEHKREGVVLRPLIELTKNNGERIIAKHKGEEFSETKTPREIDPEKMQILSDANEVAEEWVTMTRLNHVLDKINEPCMEKMKDIIHAMVEDVKREGEGEIVWSTAVEKAIGKTTAKMVQRYFQNKLHQS